MTSMSCFSYFFSVGGSSSRTTVPSTLALANPLVCSSRNSSAYSPLRPLMTGASTWKRVPSSRSITRSTICSGVCLAIGRAHTGQCGLPMRAHSSLR